MKKMKKLASVALALVMAVAMMVPAFASEATPTGSITVSNASKGEVYELVKLFDAKVNAEGTGVTYTGTVPTGLADYFEVDSTNGTIKATEAAKGSDGKLSVDAVDAIKTWAEKQEPVATKTATGTALVFENVPYGYYVVISRSENSEGGAISVDSTTPNATLTDKNTSGNNPHFPADGGKVVTTAAGDKTVYVGETVTYTVTYNTVNWIDTNDDGVAETKVEYYTIKDSLPDFLDDVTVTSITIGGETYTDHGEVPQFVVNGYKMNIMIPWVGGRNDDADRPSLYNNGAVLQITYTAVVNEKVIDNANATNEVTITPNGRTPDSDDTTTETVHSYNFGLVKTTNTNEVLGGAEFELYDSNVEATATKINVVKVSDGVYRVAKANETGVAIEAGNVEIQGLANGTYYLKETKAPAGYNAIQGFTEGVTINNGDNDATVTDGAYVDGGIQVINETGAVLPSTGGMGTTIFYALGGVLLAGSAVLFVTKKRMSR